MMQRQATAAGSTRHTNPIATSHQMRGSSAARKLKVNHFAHPTLFSSLSCGAMNKRTNLSKRQVRCMASAAPPSPAAVADERLPVTVITGFLGSGKTTLLNSLLTQKHGKRIAVIENEFGEINIDSELVVNQEVLEGSTDTITQLSNGCLCCTVRDDLILALNNLWLKRKESGIDHIVIETTGLANPAPIISSFFMDADLPDRVRLDGVVTVVDAKNVSRHLDEEKGEGIVNEAMEQVAYADRILLNKVDLVTDPSQLTALESRLRGINQMAEIKRSMKSVVDVDFVLGVDGFELASVEKQLSERLQDHSHDHHDHDHDCKDEKCTDASHNHSHDHSHSHDHDCKDEKCTDPSHNHSSPEFKHDDKVTSVSIILDGDMDLEKINYSLGFLLESRAEDIFRTKGIMAIAGSEYRFVFQGVHEMFEGVPDRKWRPDERRYNRLVFIGRYLDKEDFTEAFKGCLAGAKPTPPPTPEAALV